jgi:hypothetical protein
MVWATATSTVTGSATATPQSINLLTPLIASGASVLGITVIRQLHVMQCLATGSPTGLCSIDVGVIVADSAGGASVYDPAVSPELDWMYLSKFYVQNNSSPVGNILGNYTMPVDIRSKRKVDELGQGLIMVVTPTFAGATALATTVSHRVLVALP